MPSAVVHSASVSISGARASGVAYSSAAAATPSSSDRPQPRSASTTGMPRMCLKSSSMPAMNSVAAMPKANIDSMKPSNLTSPSPCGPSRMPSRISNTTTGTLKRTGSSASSGASTAAAMIQNTGCRLDMRRLPA